MGFGWLVLGILVYIIHFGGRTLDPSIGEYLFPPLIVGIPLALLDTTQIRPLVRKLTFTSAFLIRGGLYLFGIVLTYFLMGNYLYDFRSPELRQYVTYFVLIWGTGSLLLLASRNILEHFDRKLLFVWSLGRYHAPRTEFRAFLFIDLNDSTSIAERLGHEAYFNFLERYFSLTSYVIERHKGEIYQHVGDELIVTWALKEGEDHRPVQLFYDLQDTLEILRNQFEKEWGEVPSIKGSIHAGFVTRGEIRGKKREFIYTGDVLNAASRLQSFCETGRFELIVSGGALESIALPPDVSSHAMGLKSVKGRKEPIAVFGLTR
jgi:adenylate cyclase